MDKNTLCYIAGFFDGEGCCCIYKKPRKTCIGCDIMVTITNTDQELMIWIAKQTHLNLRQKSYCALQTKPGFECYGTGNKAIQFLKQIYPYVRSKRKHIAIALEMANMKKKNGKSHCARIPYTEEERITREALRIQMRVLNNTPYQMA